MGKQKEFLDKVLDQIVGETRIDYDGDQRIHFPFFPTEYVFLTSITISHPSLLYIFYPFSEHCKNVYGLNEEEIDYVWEKYKLIIKDKSQSLH